MGKTYGGYGSLAATVACILLDSEARSAVLEMDANHGQLREPLLKTVHVLRSLMYAGNGRTEVREQVIVCRSRPRASLPTQHPHHQVELAGMADKIGRESGRCRHQ